MKRSFFGYSWTLAGVRALGFQKVAWYKHWRCFITHFTAILISTIRTSTVINIPPHQYLRQKMQGLRGALKWCRVMFFFTYIAQVLRKKPMIDIFSTFTMSWPVFCQQQTIRHMSPHHASDYHNAGASDNVGHLSLDRERWQLSQPYNAFFQTVIPWASLFWVFLSASFTRCRCQLHFWLVMRVLWRSRGKETHGIDRLFSGLYGKTCFQVLLFFTLALINIEERRSISNNDRTTSSQRRGKRHLRKARQRREKKKKKI